MPPLVSGALPVVGHGPEFLRDQRGLLERGHAEHGQVFRLQLGIRPAGWREAAGPFGQEGSHVSVADIVDADSLARVRAYKKDAKAA